MAAAAAERSGSSALHLSCGLVVLEACAVVRCEIFICTGPIYMQSLVTLPLDSFVQNYPAPGLRVIKYAVHALQARKSCPAFYNWQVTINASGFSSVI